MFYLHPEAVQAKIVIQINNNIWCSGTPTPAIWASLLRFLLRLAGKPGGEKGDDDVEWWNILNINSWKARCLNHFLFVILKTNFVF
jgi:hypothetical protein